MRLLGTFIKLSSTFLWSFYKAFYKAYVIKSFQIYSPPFNNYVSWKYIRDSVDFKETPAGKTLLGKCVELGTSFTGETSFSSQFFFNNPEISAQIEKLAKY